MKLITIELALRASLAGPGAAATIDVDAANPPAGRNRRLSVSNPSWVQLGETVVGEEDGGQLGWSVAFSASGKQVVTDARFNNGNGENYAGRVRISDLTGTTWTQLGEGTDGDANSDCSGCAVATPADGSRVIVGTISDDGGVGADAGVARTCD